MRYGWLITLDYQSCSWNQCDHAVPYERLPYFLKAWSEDLIGFGSLISLFWACFYVIFPNLIPNITSVLVLSDYHSSLPPCPGLTAISATALLPLVSPSPQYAGSFDPMTCLSKLCGYVAGADLGGLWWWRRCFGLLWVLWFGFYSTVACFSESCIAVLVGVLV
jgi:hypothetical protein